MNVVDALPLVTPAEREAILNAPRTEDAHRSLLASLPAMNAVQIGGTPGRGELPDTLSVFAWNAERCLFPSESAENLALKSPYIVLLSEVDHGMARTGQRHTAAETARGLGMTYAFGVEFFEIGLGGATELTFCTEPFNERGWHGNAILSAVPFETVTMFRLDDHGHWFTPDFGADPEQPRVGGRNAIAAIIPWRNRRLCVVSTHLESNSGAEHRAVQFDRLMDCIDRFAPDIPVLIGGDLNTGNRNPPTYGWQDEPLFARAEARGYDWSFTAQGMTTRPSLITPHPTRQMKLDWFCARGLHCLDKAVHPALASDGRALSDHDAVWTEVSLSPKQPKWNSD